MTRTSRPTTRRMSLIAAAVAIGLLIAPSIARAEVDLTRNASTVVPTRMNPGLVDAFGNPYVVRSRLTAVRFHNGALPSTAPDGLRTTARPLEKTLNGLRYFQVTGELSGIGHSSAGFEYVYGPIDAKGVNHATDSTSPRAGLAGIPFRLVYPTNGWNGRLIVYRPAGDGGQGSGHYLYQAPTDELELVRRGYAYFVTLGGGTTPPDSNPESVTRLFWTLGPPFWDLLGPVHPASFRPAAIGANWSEQRIEAPDAGTVWPDPWDPSSSPTQISSDTPLGDLFVWIQDDVPTFRDHVTFAKNLVQELQDRRPSQTGMLAWSRSGSLAVGMNLGRTNQFPPAAISPAFVDLDLFRARTARTGGNFNAPYDPRSGRMVDWFVARSGVEGAWVPRPPEGRPEGFDLLPDTDYPITAPFTYIIGEVDSNDIQINGYLLTSLVSAALPGSKLQNKNVNAWIRLYSLKGASHLPREAWFAGPTNGGGTSWYDPLGGGLNDDGVGLEYPAWIDIVAAANPDLWSQGSDGLYLSAVPGEEAFSLQAILNTDRWARTGVPPPLSVADGTLVDNPTTSTRFPVYPLAKDCTPEVVFGDPARCLRGLNEDSVMNDPEYWQWSAGLDPFVVFLMREFASSGLQYTTTPIELPDIAAPLGYRLLTGGAVLRRPFTSGELRSRYHTHEGYVEAVRQAVARLVEQGLYDASVGAEEVEAASRSSVLR